jgi:hypothetical protein
MFERAGILHSLRADCNRAGHAGKYTNEAGYVESSVGRYRSRF